jgi:NAD-dependent dihydropyrimidine dehydrogenase PreA subunit
VPDAIALERRDGGFVPVAGPAACRGCGLCQQQCPAEGAIRIVAAEDGGDHHVRLLTPGTRGA